MDPQNKRKYGAVGLASTAGGLGLLSLSAKQHAKKLQGLATKVKTLAFTKAIQRMSGVGAVGSGLGAVYLANKYYKNRPKK